VVITSDRRVAAWGGLKANLIYVYVALRWGLGLRRIAAACPLSHLISG
jgi:hypothetical protein